MCEVGVERNDRSEVVATKWALSEVSVGLINATQHNIRADASRRKPGYNINDKNVKHIIDQYRVLNTSKEILLFVKRVGIPLLQFQAALRGTFSPDDNVVSDDEE